MNINPNIKSEADKLKKLIKYHNKKYYIESDSVISDEEYDKLFRRLQTLEKQYPELITIKSPTQTVGSKVAKSFKTAMHTVPMLSLKTETDYTEMGAQNFVSRLNMELGMNSMAFVGYVAEPKYDGLGLDLTYVDGKLILALTRGDGVEGEVVTENAKVIQDIPQFLKSHDRQPIKRLQLRGEVIMSKSAFNQINASLTEKGLKTYVNPRNAASGALRQLDPQVTKSRNLSFYAYTLISVEPSRDFSLHSEQLSFLELLGFRLSEEIRKASSVDELKYYHKHLDEIRKNIPYEIDGVVYKVDGLDYQKRLGYVSREPKWAVAHKFMAPQEKTKLLGIDIQVGRTGKLTPVARLAPVFVSGTTITNVTLHNIFDLRSRGVRVGDTVLVRRAGDVIPEITGYVKDERTSYRFNFTMPSTCPVCNGLVEREKGSREYRCTNKLLCSAQLSSSISHYCSKKAMDIEGLGDKTIELLVSEKIITNILDIYTLDASKLSRLEGFGQKTISNILQAVEDSKVCRMNKFIYALGIPNVGENTSKILSKNFVNLDELQMTTFDKLKNIKDIGPISAKSICDFISSEQFNIAKTLYMNHLNVSNETSIQNKLQGKRFVVTGSFEQHTREELKKLIEENAGLISNSVSSNVDYILAGESAGSKLELAKSKNIPVIDHAVFMEMIK